MDKLMNPFGDITRALEQFRVPGLDVGALAQAQRQQIDALVEANRAVVASMQALARKQSDMLAQAMQDVQDAAKAAASGVGVGDPVKQAELARTACGKALADMTELAEITRKAQADAIAAVTRRAPERVDAAAHPSAPRRSSKR